MGSDGVTWGPSRVPGVRVGRGAWWRTKACPQCGQPRWAWLAARLLFAKRDRSGRWLVRSKAIRRDNFVPIVNGRPELTCRCTNRRCPSKYEVWAVLGNPYKNG